MKLVSLNIWGGKLLEPLLDFIKAESADTDIFCFQETSADAKNVGEVYSIYRTDSMSDLIPALPGFHAYFDAFQEINGLFDPPIGRGSFLLGNSIFVKKGIKVNAHGHIFVHSAYNAWKGDPEPLPRNLQHVHLSDHGKEYTIANFHGLRIKNYGKGDHPYRIEQSKNIMQFLKNAPGEKVLVGDMNLDPDTESMRMLEQGMRNLITEHHITTTRSKFYEKPGRFADYALVSPAVKVGKFEVPDVEVSDHLPLVIEFT